ncbi:PAS domain-containing sensor histidine kinase [Halohasta litorea]|uniref:histidine kinase n=1 Tax=Halohasta litorea TaxID=869891 RepID=A0ABD6D6L3_9EURY|nr:PAS domain S-box protein [Halohasta litorea]
MKETVSTVFDDLEIGITLHDPETGAIVAVNSRLETLYGYREAELQEMSVADYSATDEGFTQAAAEERIRAAAEGEPQTFEWRIEQPDGERVWVRVRLALTQLDGEEYVIAEIQDISEQKERQRTLEAERSFIQQSLNTLDDVFYMLDPNGRLERWNDAVTEVTGYSDHEIDGMHAMEFFAADDAEAVGRSITEVIETGSAVVEADYVTKDGESIPYEFTGTRLTDADGEPRGIIGIGRDIADRKRHLQRIEQQEQAFRRLHQTASTSAPFEEKVAELLDFGREYLHVEQGFFTRFDDGTQEIVVGVGPNSQLQNGATAPFSESYCRHTVDPDSKSPLTVTNAVEEGWADDPAYERFELACYAGSTITVGDEVVGTICFADREPQDKAFTEIQETFIELLSEWMSYELERAERERKYRRLTERISDAYYAVDTEFTVTYWNDAMAERIDVPADDVLGENLWEYFPEIEGTVIEQRFHEAIETQEPTSCEYYYEPADYWTELQIYPDEDGLAVISKDITDRKAHEAELERSNERLQEFAYILSHDLQEPLRMVSSYVDLLETELDEHLDEETREYMTFAVDGAERMRGMIDGLLQYSRVETEGEAFEPVDVEAVIKGVRHDLQLSIDEADAELSVGSLPTIPADDDQLGQLFQNLVSNAIEHGGSTIEITGEEIASGYRFAVSDDGPGIPTHQQDEVFGLFDKGDDSDGTGIGLAICERIVTRHNGDIWVESTDDGTTFYVTIETQ